MLYVSLLPLFNASLSWQDGSYGRAESVSTLVDAVHAGAESKRRTAADTANAVDAGGLITPREGRNAQRLLDALLASNGAWIDVRYD